MRERLRKVHLYLSTDRQEDLAAGQDVLDAGERARAARFVFDKDRRLYSAAHVLLRRSLSRHAAVAAADWRFARGPHGRPEVDLDACPAARDLRFNLSHTEGLVCCAITASAALGVDAERPRQVNDLQALARRFFHPTEVAALAAEPDEDREAAFYAGWTLKEALLKAMGAGLSGGLQQFAFTFSTSTPRRITLTEDGLTGSDSGQWRFAQFQLPTSGHVFAVAARTPEGMALRVDSGDFPQPTLSASTAGVQLVSR